MFVTAQLVLLLFTAQLRIGLIRCEFVAIGLSHKIRSVFTVSMCTKIHNKVNK